jgi:hypothetical protein
MSQLIQTHTPQHFNRAVCEPAAWAGATSLHAPDHAMAAPRVPGSAYACPLRRWDGPARCVGRPPMRRAGRRTSGRLSGVAGPLSTGTADGVVRPVAGLIRPGRSRARRISVAG